MAEDVKEKEEAEGTETETAEPIAAEPETDEAVETETAPETETTEAEAPEAGQTEEEAPETEQVSEEAPEPNPEDYRMPEEEQLLPDTGLPRLTPEEAEEAGRRLSAVADNVEKVIIGKREAVELLITSLVTGGHVLIEDVPGVGKTSLVRAIAKSVDCDFRRIQFTPDLMPSDVTGFSIYNQKTGEFEFRPGGIMSNLVLADEINRASAKTQAALLEAMEEHQVTVDSVTYKLEPPFLVLATQNPVESFGTYPLPEAQIDRFLLKLSLGYATLDEETEIISMTRQTKQELEPVISQEEMLELSSMAERVYMAPSLNRYIVELVGATRTSAETVLGSSPRGGIALHDASRAYALMKGKDYVTPEDIKYLAPYILGHRMILTHEAKLAHRTGLDIIRDILDSVVVPEMNVKK
ncbi:MAG: MoxR family ATPase [Bacteroidales bacterium]|nr:MoxR family ATPase [Bacteroidales bacterium]